MDWMDESMIELMNQSLSRSSYGASWHQILTSDTEREAALAEAARRQATFQEEHVFFGTGGEGGERNCVSSFGP